MSGQALRRSILKRWIQVVHDCRQKEHGPGPATRTASYPACVDKPVIGSPRPAGRMPAHPKATTCQHRTTGPIRPASKSLSKPLPKGLTRRPGNHAAMNLPVASILVLFYTLVAWVCVWNIIVDRRADVDEPALHTHLIGIILGAVAAFGIFLIGATTVLPTKDDEVNRPINLLGRFILLLYICTLGGSRNQNLATALKTILHLVLVRIHPSSAQIHRTPQRNRSHPPLQSTIEKRLGMSPGRFFDERIGDHTLLWVALLALGIWGYTLHAISHIRDIGTTEMILTAGLSMIGIGGMFFIVLCIHPLLYLIAIIMMPFAALSVLVEAGLRICLNRSYDPWL